MASPSLGRLTVITTDLPDPPYPATVKANGYRPVLDWQRVKASKTWRLCEPEVRNHLLRLWLEAWNEVPCGSWEHEDALIAAAIDMPLRLFTAHRDQLLRGWYLATDGRLYHPVIAEMVLQMLAGRAGTAERQRRLRAERTLSPVPGPEPAVEREPAPPDNPAPEGCNALLTRESPVSNGADRTGQDKDIEVISTSPLTQSREGGAGGTATTEPARPPQRPQPRGARLSTLGLAGLPENWKDFCQTERPDLDPERTWAKFVDYWDAQPGQKGVKLDWHKTWRNWVRNERREHGHGGAESALERRAAINAEWRRRGQRAFDDMVDGPA